MSASASPAREAFRKLKSIEEDEDEKLSEEEKDLLENSEEKAEQIQEYGPVDVPEILVIGTSELGEDYVETSARGENADDTAVDIIQELAEEGGLVVSTGWDEEMFYGHIAPAHGIEGANAVLERGSVVAWYDEDGERHTEIIGDEEYLRNVTEDIWDRSIKGAAKEGYKIHPQGNEVGTAVYVEADEKGGLDETQMAIDSRERYDADELVEEAEARVLGGGSEVGNGEFETVKDDEGGDGEAISFSNSRENRVAFYEAWKEEYPLMGLRLEEDGEDVVAYRDSANDIPQSEAIEFTESITPEEANSEWNEDWNADIIPKDIPTKSEGVKYLADKMGAGTAMIYADKQQDFPEEIEEVEEYEGLTVISVADPNYRENDAAHEQTDLTAENAQEAAYIIGAMMK